MSSPSQSAPEDEIEFLRKALDAEGRRCAELQGQLDRSNAEFEEFVSLAAHNLRESLREVASYSQLLAETGASPYLERIQEGAARAQSLLGDIVEYWATGAGERQASRTDMEAVLGQVLLSTDKLITGRNAVVSHDPLPEVIGDFETLAKVLRHLIGNAIEYCEAASPRVHVSAIRADREWVFSVEDNGPGVEAAFQGRLFSVFKRQHGKEHPGNGLGLAFCKKAVAWHGGRIWMKSAPGAGSTFYFSLPPADDSATPA